MAKAKFTGEEIQATIDAMCAVTKESYGSHSFAAGYLSNMLRRCVQELPRHKQAEILQSLNTTINAYAPAEVI